MNKAGVKRIEFDRDMWKLRYVALCEMTADILQVDDEEVNRIISTQIQTYVKDNNLLLPGGKLNG